MSETCCNICGTIKRLVNLPSTPCLSTCFCERWQQSSHGSLLNPLLSGSTHPILMLGCWGTLPKCHGRFDDWNPLIMEAVSDQEQAHNYPSWSHESHGCFSHCWWLLLGNITPFLMSNDVQMQTPNSHL